MTCVVSPHEVSEVIRALWLAGFVGAFFACWVGSDLSRVSAFLLSRLWRLWRRKRRHGRASA